MKTNLSRPAIAYVLFFLVVAIAYAQFQVSNQVYNGNYNSGGSVRYANSYRSNMLPSEARYAAWVSGNLPSQNLIYAQQVGPLPSAGNAAYIAPAYTPSTSYRPTPSYSMGSINSAPQSLPYTPINPILVGQ